VRSLALVFSLLAARAAASDLPAGMPDVTLGMTQEALLEARPGIMRKNYSGVTVPVSRPQNSWNEHLTAEAWPYRHARYDVAGGRLIGVLLSGYPEPAELRAARLQAIAVAKSVWGEGYAAELVAASFVTSPVLVWTQGDRGVRLVLPPDPAPKLRQTPMITLDVRAASDRRAPESEVALPAAARAKLFEECGVEDRRPP